MKHSNHLLRNSFVLLLILWVMQSCIPHQKLKLVHEPQLYNDSLLYNTLYNEKEILPYDNLYIKVYSTDERTQALFSEGYSSIANVDPRLISYTVNDSGFLNLPFTGPIMVSNLTLKEAQTEIQSQLSRFLKNISVTVRFVGNTITILGEVNRPGEYVYYDDKISCFQALGLAGGVASYGNLTNVTLLREMNDEIKFYVLDLTQKDIVESAMYYLQPNDVIMIEPIKAKYSSLRSYNSLSIILSSLTTLALIITTFNLIPN
ncbi:MAG: polysaccharide export protein [Bacteroidota bacterium]|nr:MAG: polysaccharide export protein [Bacteroidota bacterium]